MIDKQRLELDEHRASLRKRRAAIVDDDDDDTEGIVGVYASHSEVHTYIHPDRRAEYCDDSVCVCVCLCVCPQTYLSKYTSGLCSILLAALRYVMYFRFMDDVILPKAGLNIRSLCIHTCIHKK